MNPIEFPQIVLLAGGVGGAKLADGFSQLLPPEKLTVIVNTGDDFRHFGLAISPDIDTVLYTLAGAANDETGWGRAHDSWRVISEVRRLGGPDWFALGDLDLAVHLVRTQMLANGHSLTEITRHLGKQLGVAPAVLPMSDDPAPTMIRTDSELLPFQTWFVQQRWQPVVREVQLPADARATPAVMAALEKADIVVLAPSNPFVSIDPILNVYPIREMVMDLPRSIVAVSPIIAGKAVKGPAAKMMSEMGMATTASAVAAYYHELIDVFVYDLQDQQLVSESDVRFIQLHTLMLSQADRLNLASEILKYLVEKVI